MDADFTIDFPKLQLQGSFTCRKSPVQAAGTVAGYHFYFRSRYEDWSFAVQTQSNFEPEDICFEDQGFLREGSYGTKRFEASYMPLAEARRIIRDCAEEFLKSQPA